jgi:hypothetical protein
LQPGDGLQFYGVSFSPDSRYMVYFRTWLEHPILNLVDMLTGEEQHIPLGEQYNDAGAVVWSPERDRIILGARTGIACESLHYWLLQIDLDDLDLHVLMDSSDFSYHPVDWIADDLIILQVGYMEYSLLDLATGEISPYTMPTATPGP